MTRVRHVGDPREPRSAPPEPTASEAVSSLEHARRFTATYRRHAGADPATREAACLAVQYPTRLLPLRRGDLVAGRARDVSDFLVEFSPQSANGGGYCVNPLRIEWFAELAGNDYGALASELLAFWEEATTQAQTWQRWNEQLDTYVGTERNGRAGAPGSGRLVNTGGIRLAGLMLDFGRLVRLGIPGLRHRIADGGDADGAGSRGGAFRAGLAAALDVLCACLDRYAAEADCLLAAERCPAVRRDLTRLRTTLKALPQRAPETFHEALQLFWLYAVVSGVRNYGRFDDALGTFYARDLDEGRLDEAEGLRLLVDVWQRIVEANNPADSRIVVGGVGRRDPGPADRLALAAMEATRQVRRIVPCLTLRFTPGRDGGLMGKGLDVVGEGCLYPMLYNDAVNVPAVERFFRVPREDAEQYLPLGCGETVIGGMSLGSPNTVLNVPKCVEAALHNGCCAVSGERVGAATGGPEALASFDALCAAVHEQVRFVAPLLAKVHVCEYEAEATATAFLLPSLLLDDCLDRGVAAVAGGVRYRGGCVEGFGFTNAGDSLAAIEHVVFERQEVSLPELVASLDRNFAGEEALRQRLLRVPKFGNGAQRVDALVADLTAFIGDTVMAAGRDAGLDYLVVSNVNPGGILLGMRTAASADGRRLGEPFAIGNGPTAGRDREGVTSLLQSVCRVRPDGGGTITNLKLTPDLFGAKRKALEDLLASYWAGGGAQVNLTVVDREALEDALMHPEAHADIMVRIGGWSARFVDLDPVTQREVLARTLYG